tara:strand:+ start:526 stop:843 length:318 start_codon:yes stop_codon:yes gene_type:complete
MGVIKDKPKRIPGPKPKKRKLGGVARSPVASPYTDQDMKHVGWCTRNKISIACNPRWDSDDLWDIEINIKNSRNIDPQPYEGTEIMAKVYKYYKYYYDKYNEDKI